MIVRRSFPQVYRLKYRNGSTYWMVSARSKKWGMDERRTFGDESEALHYAKEVEARIIATGAQPTVPLSVKTSASAYDKLVEQLRPYNKTPEEAVAHFIKFLGQEVIRSVKPFISDLTERWLAFKKTDKTLTERTLNEAEHYCRFIKRTWGTSKPDDIKRNHIDLTLKNLNVSNNTRKKHLTYIRMFFKWVRDEGFLSKNPTDGIKFKPDAFEAAFYTPEETKKLLRFVAEQHPDLIGYYSILIFAGLRPTEGSRVQWEDINFKTCELYVRKGKTQARHILLEPVMMEWLQWHKAKSEGKPFVQLKALPNRERVVREFMSNWIQDGLRHGFGTYYRNLKKNINLTAEVMGNSPSMVKKHYARTIELEKVKEFWGLTPEIVTTSTNP